jgi:hypothetical protein
MRLFHSFLLSAYPQLPVGSDQIWDAAVPSFAHNVRDLSIGKRVGNEVEVEVLSIFPYPRCRDMTG